MELKAYYEINHAPGYSINQSSKKVDIPNTETNKNIERRCNAIGWACGQIRHFGVLTLLVLVPFDISFGLALLHLTFIRRMVWCQNRVDWREQKNGSPDLLTVLQIITINVVCRTPPPQVEPGAYPASW